MGAVFRSKLRRCSASSRGTTVQPMASSYSRMPAWTVLSSPGLVKHEVKSCNHAILDCKTHPLLRHLLSCVIARPLLPYDRFRGQKLERFYIREDLDIKLPVNQEHLDASTHLTQLRHQALQDLPSRQCRTTYHRYVELGSDDQF